jgi:hypothetical protein
MTSEDLTARLPDAGIVHGFKKRLELFLYYIRKKSYQNDFNYFFILGFMVSGFFNDLY